jgi:hypothetical protein
MLLTYFLDDFEMVPVAYIIIIIIIIGFSAFDANSYLRGNNQSSIQAVPRHFNRK